MDLAMSQPATKEGWLTQFLAGAQAGEVVICVRWCGEPPQVVLAAFSKWSTPYLLNACLVRWRSVGEYCLLARLTVEPSQLLSTTATSGRAPIALRLRNSLKRSLRYVDRWRATAYLVEQAPANAEPKPLRAL